MNLNLILNFDNWNEIASLLLACIELILLVNLLIFSEKNKTNTFIFIIIALLTGYQAFEFLICSVGIDSSVTAYFAFVDISFLPPLNLLLVLNIFRNEYRLKYLLFIPAIFFTIYYFRIVEKFAIVECTVLYATYNYPLGDIYGFFYYLPLSLSFLYLLIKRKGIDKKQYNRLFAAHLFIVLPVLTGFILLYLNLPGLIKNMASILCKFAFGYAVALSIFCLKNKTELK